jgi:AhpD family alkylhydroperoxidase
MKNPVTVVPGIVAAIQTLIEVTRGTGIDPLLFHLVHLRVSQINGCSYCLDSAIKHAKHDGESDERLHAVGAWREMPHFSEAERAALRFAEVVTHLDERDPIPELVWNEAAQHFNEQHLAGLVLWASTVNMLNRVNMSIRRPAG